MKNLTLLIKPASGACQYNCRYCFYKEEMGRRESASCGEMSIQTLEALVKKAFAAADEFVSFAFQGGEPTLRGIDFFKTLCQLQKKYSKGKAYANSLQTNGGLLNSEWAEFIKKEHFLVGLSLDGLKADHDKYRTDIDKNGTWDRTVEAAALMKEYGIPFNVLSVVTDENVKRPQETYEFLRLYRFIQFIPCLDPLAAGAPSCAPSAEDYADFLKETFLLYERDLLRGEYTSVRLFDNYVQILAGARPESCAMNGVCSVSFTIEGNGSVYPCDFYCLDEWRLGNVNDAGFPALCRSENAKRFVNSSVVVREECKKCKYYYLCRGGCRRERTAGDITESLSLNRYCEAYKTFFDFALGRLMELKQKALVQLQK